MSELLVGLLKTAVYYFLFGFVVPPIMDTFTKNRLIKLPVAFVMALLAGWVMAWTHYAPWLLLVFWVPTVHHPLQAMSEPPFQAEFLKNVGEPQRLWLFRTAHYGYALLSCLLALFLQTEVSGVGGSPETVPVWRWLVGAN